MRSDEAAPLRWIPLSFAPTGVDADHPERLQLHAPGLPDRLFADGLRLGWQDWGGLFLHDGEQTAFLPLPGVVDVAAASPELWVAVTDAPEVCWGVPGQPWQRRPLPPGRWRAGGAWLHGRCGTQHLTLRRETGEAVPSPMGAASAWPLPDREGLAWTNTTALYRLDAAGRVQVIDALPAGCRGIRAGSAGTILVELSEGAIAASVGGRLLVALLEASSLEGGCTSPDGRQALLRTEEGSALFDLATGEVLRRFEATSPVGFVAGGAEVLLLEDEEGLLRDGEGQVWGEGFVPAAVLRVEARLYGPGAAAWDLAEGARLYQNPVLSAEALLYDDEDGEALVFALQEEVVVILEAETGEILGEEPREGEAASGELSAVLSDPLPGETEASGLAVESGAAVGGRQWLWSGEGLLLSRPAGAT